MTKTNVQPIPSNSQHHDTPNNKIEKHCKSGKVRKSKWPELQFGGHYRPKYDPSEKEAAFPGKTGCDCSDK